MAGTLMSSGGSTGRCTCKNWCPDCDMPKCRPVQESEWAPGTLNTEYLDRYPEKNAVKSIPVARPGYVPSLAKFDDRTVNKSDYSPKALDAKRVRPSVRPMPQVPFEGMSTYNANHDGKAPCPEAAKPARAADYSAPFYGQSTKQADYVDHGNQVRSPCKPGSKVFTCPFDGASTYATDFDRKQRAPSEPRARDTLLQSNNVPNATTYAEDFVPKPFVRRARGTCCDHRTHGAVATDTTQGAGCAPGRGCCADCGSH